MDSVGERIKQIRISKGITQAELADAIGTTKAAISRYELDKRELRFAQAQGIADFLGVSVFELYGFPGERQIQLENTRKVLARIREATRHMSEENPDEATLKAIEAWQSMADEIEKELQSTINIVAFAHNAQVRVNLFAEAEEKKTLGKPLQPNPELKQRNKRIDNLVSMFTEYSYDVQTRILDIVATFGQLNSVGQKHAVGRTKELAEIPRYRAQQESDDET